MKDQKNVYENEFFVLWWIDGLLFDGVVWLGKTYPGIWPAWSCDQEKHICRYDLSGGEYDLTITPVYMPKYTSCHNLPRVYPGVSYDKP